MSWITHHSESERYAGQAEMAIRKGDQATAATLYHRAAVEESAALGCLDKGKKRTLGITVVSAASLFFKATDFREAERVAHQWLADSDHLPSFAIEQLQAILRTIWAKTVPFPESSETMEDDNERSEKVSDFKEERLTGILRGLHLDDDWLEVNLFERDHALIRIYQTGDAIDDWIGPLVNRQVTVDVLVKPDGKRLFRDIRSDLSDQNSRGFPLSQE